MLIYKLVAVSEKKGMPKAADNVRKHTANELRGIMYGPPQGSIHFEHFRAVGNRIDTKISEKAAVKYGQLTYKISDKAGQLTASLTKYHKAIEALESDATHLENRK